MYNELEKDLKSFMRKLGSEKKFDETRLVKEGFQELVRLRINLKEMTERAEESEAKLKRVNAILDRVDRIAESYPPDRAILKTLSDREQGS